MKKYFGIMVGLLMLAACSNDEFRDNLGNNEGVKSFTSLTASLDNMAATRAHITEPEGSGRKYVAWDDADQILVFSDEQRDFKTYILSNKSDDGIGYFTGENVSGNGKFYALYSARGWTADNDNPDILHYDMSNTNIAGGYNDFDFRGPMLASSEGNNFTFRQLTGLIHVTIGDIFMLERVTLRGNNGEALAGMASVDLSDETSALAIDDESASQAVTIGLTEQLDETSTDFYFFLPPTTFEKGFTLCIDGKDEEGNSLYLEKTTANELTIERGTVNHFSLINVNAELEALQEYEIGVITPSEESTRFFEEGITMTAMETTRKIKFTTNKNWTISIKTATEEWFNGMWYDIDVMSGAEGEAEITITLDENYSDEDRELVFTITAGNESKDIRILQKLLPVEQLPEFIFVPFKKVGNIVNLFPENVDKEKKEKLKKELDDIDGNIDFGMFGRNGVDYLYKFQDNNPNIPEKMIVYNSNEDDVEVTIIYDSDGLPREIITEESIITLNSLLDNTFDAEVLTSNGDYLQIRDVKIDKSLEQYKTNLKMPIQIKRPLTEGTDVEHLFSTNTITGAISCAISAVGTVTTSATGVGLYLGIGLTYVSCAGAFDSMMVDLENKYPLAVKVSEIVLGITSPTNFLQYKLFRLVGNMINNPIGDGIIGVGSCIAPVFDAIKLKKGDIQSAGSFIINTLSCVTSMVNVGINIANAQINNKNNNLMTNALLNQLKQNQNATLQIVLIWDYNDEDLNLSCLDPVTWEGEYHVTRWNNDPRLDRNVRYIEGGYNNTVEKIIYPGSYHNGYIGDYTINVHSYSTLLNRFVTSEYYSRHINYQVGVMFCGVMCKVYKGFIGRDTVRQHKFRIKGNYDIEWNID